MRVLERLFALMKTVTRLTCIATLVASMQLAIPSAAIASIQSTGYSKNSNTYTGASLLVISRIQQILHTASNAYDPPDYGGPGTSGGSGTRYKS